MVVTADCYSVYLDHDISYNLEAPVAAVIQGWTTTAISQSDVYLEKIESVHCRTSRCLCNIS